MRKELSEDEAKNSGGVAELSPRPALAVRHCGDTYKACCLPWGWCNCICGDCRVAKYATLSEESLEGVVSDLVARFWAELGDQQAFYVEPKMVYPDPIFRMKTRGTFMFDDYFWEVFQRFPFKICHITFLTKYLTGDDGSDEQVFDLRFAIGRG